MMCGSGKMRDMSEEAEEEEGQYGEQREGQLEEEV